MRKLIDAQSGRRFDGRQLGFGVRTSLVAVALLIGNLASAMAQPRDGTWEGDDSSGFTIRFLVRGHGTEVVVTQFGFVRSVCPTGQEIGISVAGGYSFVPIGDNNFTYLDDMVTPRRAEAARFHAFVVQGTFPDSLHAEGKVTGWLAMFSGQGVRTQACPVRAKTWEATWVGNATTADSASGGALREDVTVGGRPEIALETLDEVAMDGSTQTVYLDGPEPSGPVEHSITLRLDPEEHAP